jgi:hypothetical protein
VDQELTLGLNDNILQQGNISKDPCVINHFFRGHPESPSNQPYVVSMVFGKRGLQRMKASWVEPGHLTMIFVNLGI